MKMEKKGILITIVILLFIFININMLNAEGDLGTFKKNSCVELFQICDSCTFVNLSSITFPENSSKQDFNVEMLKNEQSYNFSFCNTSVLGQYAYNVCGDKEGTLNCERITFSINGLGKDIETPESILYVILMISVLILFSMFLTIAILTPYDNVKERHRDLIFVKKINKLKYVKLVSIWIAYGFFMWFITMVTGISNNYILFEGLRGMANSLYTFLYVGNYVIGVSIMWFIFINIWRDIIFNREIIKSGQAVINLVRR